MSFLLYFLLGALVTLLLFKVDKFKECIPQWYANYRIKLDSEGNRDVFTDSEFTKVVLFAAVTASILLWPVVVIAKLYKKILGSK